MRLIFDSAQRWHDRLVLAAHTGGAYTNDSRAIKFRFNPIAVTNSIILIYQKHRLYEDASFYGFRICR